MPSKKLANSIVGLLIIQFVLGILANLYQQIPQDKPYEVFKQFGYIAFHALNGTLLLALGAVFLYQAIKRKAYKVEAISGLGALVFAFAFGELFVFTQNNIFSLFMSLAFISALMRYTKVVYTMDEKKAK